MQQISNLDLAELELLTVDSGYGLGGYSRNAQRRG